jgi:hypothetical protein
MDAAGWDDGTGSPSERGPRGTKGDYDDGGGGSFKMRVGTAGTATKQQQQLQQRNKGGGGVALHESPPSKRYDGNTDLAEFMYNKSTSHQQQKQQKHHHHRRQDPDAKDSYNDKDKNKDRDRNRPTTAGSEAAGVVVGSALKLHQIKLLSMLNLSNFSAENSYEMVKPGSYLLDLLASSCLKGSMRATVAPTAFVRYVILVVCFLQLFHIN